MRPEFQITIDFYDQEGKLDQKVFTVTPNFAARKIIDDRLGGPLGFFLRHQETQFSRVTVSEITCFAWALIRGAGYDITEEKLGEHFNDIGEVQGIAVILPILNHWIERAFPSSKKKTKPTSASRRKRTRSQ